MDFWEIIKVIVFGIVEGITEWLPVSSTGHLILFDRFLPLNFSEAFMEMFEYVIQLAAIAAVVVVFFKRIFPVGKRAQTENGTDGKSSLYLKKDVLSLWGKVLVACIPALLAFVIDKLLLDNVNELVETMLIACALIFYGAVFLLLEKRNERRQPKITEMAQLSYKTAFWIGCFQVLAIIPGTSRSGITIIGALLLAVDRTTSAEFTFFLAIPTMVGASAYKILGFFLDGNGLLGAEVWALVIGCAVAFAVSLAAVKFLMGFVKKHDFKVFGWYRIALGLLVIATLVLPNFF